MEFADWANGVEFPAAATLDYDFTSDGSADPHAWESDGTVHATDATSSTWLVDHVADMGAVKNEAHMPKYLCDANRALEDQGGLYYVGRCGQDGGSVLAADKGKQNVCQRHADLPECVNADKEGKNKGCGLIQVLEFAQGNMILEYEAGEEPCSGGMFLPFFPGEMMWNKGPHLFIYFITMIMSFLGIAIIADVFMAAIETITSKTMKSKDGREVMVWNPTVANLTLMALGSSAPEILLSVLETVGILGVDASPGGLGPGTIVGSAAFNLLVIVGICVMCIPKGETRRIKVISVFNVTAFFSVFAYLWLFIVVSDDNVALWEAIVTIGQFPILVLICYKLDKKASAGDSKVIAEGEGANPIEFGKSDKKDPEALAKALCQTEAGKGLAGLLLEKGDPAELRAHRAQLAHLAVQELQAQETKSALQSKIEARRALAGRQRIVVQHQDPAVLASLSNKSNAAKEQERSAKATVADDKHGMTYIEFSTPEYAVPEAQPFATLHVTRYGNVTTDAVVYYTTKDGSAMSGEDFVHTRGKLEFKAGVTELAIKVPLIDDTEFEPDEDFFVQLKMPKTGNKGDKSDEFEFGALSIAKVTILNDDNPGHFNFSSDKYSCSETDGQATVTIKRTNGSSGSVTVNLNTVDGTAKAGADFVAMSNKAVVFDDGEMEKTVKIDLVEDDAFEKSETFNVTITLADGAPTGAAAGTVATAEVTILGDEEMQQLARDVAALMKEDFEHTAIETTSYGQQFAEAMNVAGEEGEDPALMDYIMHFLTFGWKVMFATCPPTSYSGGWATFFVALGMIGVLTAFVADIAGIFGCLLGLDDGITAITFVALGTSLPDTFASKSAAVGDETADNAVGNVTGSNAVNVYLGLGLPWIIATLVNTISGFTPMGVCSDGSGGQGESERAMVGSDDKITCSSGSSDAKGDMFIRGGNKGDYPMASGSLGFSVIIFCICACTCIGTIYLRRAMFGAELGGPMASVTGLFFFFLWMVYVVMSSLETEGHIESFI